MQNIKIKVKHKCASIMANSRKPFENYIENEKNVQQVNLKVRVYFLKNIKNIRLNYIVLLTVKSHAGSDKRNAWDNNDTSLNVPLALL